jgi:hypothetical protein
MRVGITYTNQKFNKDNFDDKIVTNIPKFEWLDLDNTLPLNV